MPDLSTEHRMTAYMAWANGVVLTNAERLPTEEIEAPRDALFGSIAGTFDHILVVAEMFRAHLEGRENPHTERRRKEALKFRDTAHRLRDIDRHLVALAREWSDEELAKTVGFAFVDGGNGAMTRSDILLHLVNHATYHRGFVSTLLYPIRSDGAASDLTVFLRDAWPGIRQAK